ncbi:hypothetical protein HOI83_02400 [Candidatus Uhrbacteria bacterium]|jgi:hypothetical protein|nr:hypothetical protein [Candidatus Uhrbacteria bacterium]
MNYPQRLLSFSCYSFIVAAFGVLLFAAGANAAPITVNCAGSSGAPTAVTESTLTGNDVTFANTGSGYCELDTAFSSSSVIVDAGVTLTHAAADATGVDITTTGLFTLNGDIDVSDKGEAQGLPGAGSGGGELL